MTNERHEKALEAAVHADGFTPNAADRNAVARDIATYLQVMDAVIVPKTPTPEMIGAWYRYKNGHHWPDEQPALDTSDYGAYRAMLSKAPNHFTNGE